MRVFWTTASVLVIAAMLSASPGLAQQGQAGSAAADTGADTPQAAEAANGTGQISPRIGQVTGRPVPRFVSMKASTGRARRGPSMSHRIDWVFTQRDLPLMITDEFGLWRRVKAVDGTGGWMHYVLLSGVRYVIVTAERATLHLKPDTSSPVTAFAERDVIAKLVRCNLDWCRVSSGGYNGWVRKSEVWGVADDEILR